MALVDVCFSPELLSLYELKGRAVVVVDILRATSTMVTAFANGVEEIVPVMHLEQCLALKEDGYLTAGERDGKMAEGCDLGNSPFSYTEGALSGHKIAMTTTNGTKAIALSTEADVVLVGAFLNIGRVAEILKELKKDVLIVCAGWKGKFNLEDTLFAGALIERLSDLFTSENDSALAALALYQSAKNDMLKYLSASSHVNRLLNLNITRDVEFCLKEDMYEVVPALQGAALYPYVFVDEQV